MAEAIGIAGSIAGLVQIAGAVFRLAFKFIKDVKDAKSHVKALVDELQILGGILHRLTLLVASLEEQGNNAQNMLLSRQVRSCRQTLSRIEKPLLAAWQDFETKKTKSWKHQLKWPFDKEETKELLSELDRHKETLSLALTTNSINTMLGILSGQKDANELAKNTKQIARAQMDVTTRIVADQNRLRILNYFMKWDPQPIFTQALQEHHPSTGLWLIDSEEFIQWSETPGSKLWLTGIPGAGKTVLAAAMLENLIQQDSDRTGVAFFFCSYSETTTHDAVNILCTLAAQIARQSPSAFDILRDYYEELHPDDRLSKPADVTRLTAVLVLMFNEFDRVLIVVDGLDECKDNVVTALDALTGLTYQYSSLSLALLSRDELSIRSALTPDFKVIAVSAHKEDLQQYTVNEIEKRIRKRQLRLRNLNLKDEIITALVGGADGMFRWVSCQIDHLCRLHNDKARQEALRSLPPGLNATYERILERITSTDEHVRLLVSRVLLLITFASPSLTIPELCEALATCEDIDEFDKSVEIDEEEIAFQCTSLIRKSANGKSFELAHFTVREFLQQKVQGHVEFDQYHLEESRATRLLLDCSLRFLLLKNFARHPEEAVEEDAFMERRNQEHPFYEYASKSIPVLASASKALGGSTPLVMRLFDSQKSSNFTSWALDLLSHYRHGSWKSWVSSRGPPSLVRRTKTSEPASDVDPSREIAPEPDGRGSNRHFDDPDPDTSARIFQNAQYSRHGTNHVNEDDTNIYTGGPAYHWESLLDLVYLVRHSSFSTLHMASLLGLSNVCREILAIDDKYINVCSKIGSPLHCALGGPFLLSSHGLSRIRYDVASFERPCMDTLELLVHFGGHCSARMETPVGVLTIPSLAFIVSSLLEDFEILERVLMEDPSVDEMLNVLLKTSSVSKSPLLRTVDANLTTNREGVLRIMDSVMTRTHDGTKKAICNEIIKRLQVRENCSEEEPFSYPPIASGNLRANIDLAFRYDNAQWLDHLLSSSEEGHAIARGDWILQSAFEQKAEQAFQLILSHNARGKVASDVAHALLLRCCTNERIGFLECLLDNNVANSRAVDHFGDTVYHIAAKKGSDEILRSLLAHGNDATERHPLHMTNQDGRTPLAEALIHDQGACAAVIIKSRESEKAILQCKTPSLFSLIAKVKSPDTLKMLAQADLLPRAEGRTPLHHIDNFSNPRVLQFLLSVYPYTQSSDGKTPMDIFVDWCLRDHRRPGRALSEARMKTMELLVQHELSYTSQISKLQDLWQKFAKRLCSKGPSSEHFALMVFKAALHSGAIAAYEDSVDRNAISEFEPIFAALETPANAPALAVLAIPILESSVHTEWFGTEPAFQALQWSVLIRSTENVRYLVPRILDKAGPDRLNGINPTGEGLGLLHMASSRAYPPYRGSLHYPEERGALRHALRQAFDVPWPQHSEHSAAGGYPVAPRGRVVRYLYGLPILSPNDIEALYDRHRIQEVSSTTQKATIHEILLGSGLDPNLRSREAEIAPLSMHLCMNAPLAVLNTLLAHAARYDSGSADKYGWTPVAWACLLGRLDFLHHLVYVRKGTNLWEWEAQAKVRFQGVQMTIESVRCTALHLAILSRDTTVVEFVLSHMHPNILYMSGLHEKCTPVHLALQQEGFARPGLLNMLMRHGADINAPGPHKWSPLHIPALRGDVNTASILISHGAINVADRYGRTPIYYALKAKHYDCALVLAGSMEAAVTTKLGMSAELRIAMADAFQGFIEDDDLDACQGLVNMGCPLDIRMPYCHQCTPLLYALWLGRTAIVDWLLRAGADIHCTACQAATVWRSALNTSSDGKITKIVYPSMTVLDMMLWKDDFRGLLPQWLSLMSESQFRWLAKNSTAVHVAVQRCSMASLGILLSHAAGLKDDLGNTLSKSLANSFFSDYPKPASKKGVRTTPLNRAICLKNLEAAKMLIDYGAETSASQYLSTPALHLAAETGSFEILEYILRSSVMINAPDRHGQNALLLAVMNNHSRCAKLLMEHGAKLQDNYGSSMSVLLKVVNTRALDLCLDDSYKTCSEYTWTISQVLSHVLSYKLKSGTARQSHIVAANSPFLMKIPVSILKYYWANYCQGLLSMQILRWDVRNLGLGAQGARLLFERVEATGESFSALCFAASFDLLPVVKGLLEVGFDDEFIDADLGSPLSAALRSGQKEVVKFLIRRGCALTGIGHVLMKVATHFPDMLDWLLVQRFNEQGNLLISDEDKEPQDEKPWSGVVKTRFRLLGNHRQEWSETNHEYTMYLHRLRRDIAKSHGIHSTAAPANRPRESGLAIEFDALDETDIASDGSSGEYSDYSSWEYFEDNSEDNAEDNSQANIEENSDENSEDSSEEDSKDSSGLKYVRSTVIDWNRTTRDITAFRPPRVTWEYSEDRPGERWNGYSDVV